jgi:hypothetical protein
MGSIDRGIGRATSGATASAYGRQLQPAISDSPLSHSQAMILGGFAPGFLLFVIGKRERKRAAMYVGSVLSARAVSASVRSRAISECEGR